MASDDRSAKFAASVSGEAAHHGRKQDQILQELLRQAREGGLTNGHHLLSFFEALPAATLASERAEYERIVRRYGAKDQHAKVLEESIARLELTEAQARRGQRRAARAMETATMPGAAFQGFVMDESGEPMPGMTVRLQSPRLRAPLLARTEADGHFRIDLTNIAGGVEKRDSQLDVASIDVLDLKGKAVYEDPMPLQLSGGRAYREYTIGEKAGR